MLDYSGLIPPYKINRPLREEEVLGKLDIHAPIDGEPLYQAAVIHMNSTDLEMADKYYGARGVLLLFMLAMECFCIYVLINSFHKLTSSVSQSQIEIGWSSLIISLIFFSPFLIFSTYAALKESFTYTHWPIRFNRKNRKVYVFRHNGANGVLTVPWDKVYWHLGRGASSSRDIRGHVLAEDGVTVLDTFSVGTSFTDPDWTRRHWEFVRRYMEQGPQSLIHQVEYCLPIAHARETYQAGLRRLFLEVQGAPLWMLLLIFAPVFIPASLARWIGMRTSQIPRWPDWVEAECAVEPQDPYRRDSGWMAPTPPKDRAVGRRPPPRY